MKKYVPENTITSIALLALAGGAAALFVWSLRKRKIAQRNAATAESHLEHTSPERGYSRWATHKYASAAGSLGAATR